MAQTRMHRRLLTGAAALAAATALVAAPSAAAVAAVPTFEETAEYVFDDGSRTGSATDTAADTAVFTRTQGASVEVVTLDASGAPIGEQTLTAPVAGGGYGVDVALNEDASLLYVAQPQSSQIHVYHRPGGSWELQRTLTAPSELPDRVDAYGSNVGSVIDVSGQRLVVGVPNARVDGRANAGFAFAVDLTTDTWQPLIPADPIADSITGAHVAVAGDRVALGAPQVRGADRARIGGVYLWDLSSDAEPAFTAGPDADPRMCIPTAGSGPAFGSTLAFTDAGLAVGSPIEIHFTGDDPNDPETGCTDQAVAAGNTTQGAIYLFDDQLQQIGLKAVAPLQTTDFAGSIGVSGDALVARGWQEGNVGYAFVYDLSTWDQAGPGDENGRIRPDPVQTLSPASGTPNFGISPYGTAISVSATQVVVGTWQIPGAAHIFGAPAVAAPLSLSTEDVAVTYGQTATLAAQVASGDAPDGAAVRFAVAGDESGVAPIVAGVARVELPAASHEAALHPFTAEPVDDDGNALGAAASGTLTVEQAATETRAARDDSGDRALRGSVTAEFGTVPTGAVEVIRGGETFTTVQLDAAGAFSWEPPASDADENYTLAYAGDRNHLASEAQVAVAADPAPAPPGSPEEPPAPSPPASDPPRGSDLASTGSEGTGPWFGLAAGAALVGGLLLTARLRGLRGGRSRA